MQSLRSLKEGLRKKRTSHEVSRNLEPDFSIERSFKEFKEYHGP